MKMNGNDLGLDQLGLTNLINVHRNLPVKELVDDIVKNGEGVIGLRGAAMVDTGDLYRAVSERQIHCG